jgi:protein-L-isoaspartate(D-aspartate) O-methyltransferase
MDHKEELSVAKKTLPLRIDALIVRHGAVFRIERRGSEYLAKWISPVGVYPCEGGRDDASEAALDAALQRGGGQNVTRLYAPTICRMIGAWLRAPGWALAYT